MPHDLKDYTPTPTGYWSECIASITEAIRSMGWKVEPYADLGARYQGCCDYDTRTIMIDCANARKAFLTLCHEDGHRQAFVYWGGKSEKHFERLCPRTAFREHQALVFGWNSVQQFDPEHRITLATWLHEHGCDLKWRGV